ncbi:hypothetical protein E2C01_045836 [Portunus trituberculatus]|uniref:Uncharacterized protein n=1 Tax=Portunus trituberculatus TaxID=210409 RepID=A0A5B7G327_PORTR|nr:hypothetical protein [Portunus trituberculatus]
MVYADLPDDVYHASITFLEVKCSSAVISFDDNMAAQTDILQNLITLKDCHTSKAS